MIKEISLNRNNAIVNFSVKYCSNYDELLNSDGFKRVLLKYIKSLKKSDSLVLDRLETKDFDDTITNLFKLLMVLDVKSLSKMSDDFKSILGNKRDLIEFIEGLYNYWRGLERYALIESEEFQSGIQNKSFIDSTNNFSNLILDVYRTIEEKIMGYGHNIYRQTTAGVNAGLVLTESHISLPEEYAKLEGIKPIKQIIMTPPFIIYPKLNKRSGFFTESEDFQLDKVNVNTSHYFCYPAKVGGSIAFVYFHRDFMSMGVSLCNLFELAKPEEYKDRKPDLVYLFGGRLEKEVKETSFYIDKKNDIYFGFASNTSEVDYFGYMKKMILTLHNLRMIDKGYLPIHGAMVNITFKNGLSKNICIIGDSGAGKSESLEAFRTLSEKYLKEIQIIFDDMGTFEIKKGKVYGYGTEVGAFVRLDDLEAGYSFNQMDRAIFMNPQRINARLLMPISTYDTISTYHKVDLLLYANNYTENGKTLEFFDTVEEAIKIFKEGKRKAKGTTTEDGIVESYFANPFGPYQKQEANDIILDRVFNKLFENKIPVGQIYTRLAIEGYEFEGPKKAAKKLFKWLNE